MGAKPGVGTAVQAGIGVIQAGVGIGQSISANKRLKRLLQQREDYKTPELVNQQFQIAQNEAQQGYSSETLAYLNSQQNNALTSSLNTVTKLGGNANNIADIFSRNVDAIMKTASDSEMSRVLKFDKLYTSIVGVIAGQDAEFADRRAKHDDAMASAQAKLDAAKTNIQSGVNNVVGAFANKGIADKGNPAVAKQVTGGVNVMPVPLTPGVAASATQTSATPNYSSSLNWWSDGGWRGK